MFCFAGVRCATVHLYGVHPPPSTSDTAIPFTTTQLLPSEICHWNGQHSEGDPPRPPSTHPHKGTRAFPQQHLRPKDHEARSPCHLGASVMCPMYVALSCSSACFAFHSSTPCPPYKPLRQMRSPLFLSFVDVWVHSTPHTQEEAHTKTTKNTHRK